MLCQQNRRIPIRIHSEHKRLCSKLAKIVSMLLLISRKICLSFQWERTLCVQLFSQFSKAYQKIGHHQTLFLYHSLSPKENFYFCVFKDDIEKSVCFEILVYFHEDKNFNNYLAISIVKSFSVEIAFYPMHAQFLLFKSTGIGFFFNVSFQHGHWL